MDYGDEKATGGAGCIESEIPSGHSGGSIQKVFEYTQLGLQKDITLTYI